MLTINQLIDFAKVSPSYYHKKHVTGEIREEAKDSLRRAQMLRMAILEPDRYAAVPTVPGEHLTPSGGLSTKKATKEWLESLPSRDFVTPTERDEHLKISEGVWNSDAADILEDYEANAVAKRELGRAEAHALTSDAVVLIRGTRDLNRFVDDCREFHYPEVLEWVRLAFDRPKAYIIAVEKSEPYRVGVVNFHEKVEKMARANIGQWVLHYNRCQEDGIWPNNPPGIITITAADLNG